MPRDDRDVFDTLRADPQTPVEIDLLTYAFYALQRYEWHRQFEAEQGHQPDATEVARWIGDITPDRFETMRQQAADLFDTASRDYLAADIERQKQEAVRTSILSEVKAAGAFWKQMAIALVTAILAPLIIGSIIAAALTYDRVWPTASQLSHQLEHAPTAPP